MTDQFAVRRRALHGSRDAALGSGFAAVEVIRPTTVSAGASLAPGATGLQPVRPRIITTAPAPASAGGAAAAATAATKAAPAGAATSSPAPATALRRSLASGTPAAVRATPGAATTGAAALGGALPGRAGSPPVPAIARANLSGTAFAGTAFAEPTPTGAVLRRSFVVAPPPISLGSRRSTSAPPVPSSAAAPAAPAAASTAAAPATAAPAGARSSIYTAAADLFRTFGGTSAAQRGGDMTDSSSSGAHVIRRLSTPSLAAGGAQGVEATYSPHQPAGWSADAGSGQTVAPAGASLNPRQLDELVDQVVDRIEQRVIDELERRGRFGIVGGM